MLKMTLSLFVTITIVIILQISGTKSAHYTALMVHAEPYSWKNETSNKTIGLIPDLLHVLSIKCENITFDVRQVHWSMKQLREITMSDDPLSDIKKTTDLGDIGKNIIIGMKNVCYIPLSQTSLYLKHPSILNISLSQTSQNKINIFVTYLI